MSNKLILVSVNEVGTPQPAAFHEHAAMKYLGMNRAAFREIVFAGLIPFTIHVNGSKRIYLRSDLDAYLESLPRSRMAPREHSPKPAPFLKGVGN